MASAFLKIVSLLVAQTGKEAAVNAADAILEHATQRTVDIDFTSGDVSLTEDQHTTNYMFRCTNVGADQILTIQDDLDSFGANTAERVFAVENTATGDFTITVTQDGGGTDVIILPGEQVSMYADGTDVKRLDNSMDIGTFTAGVPTASQLMMRFTATRSFVLPVDLIGSAGNFTANATGAHGYIIRKNGGSSLGTVDVAMSAAVATFTFTVATQWDRGDVLSIEAPASPDATSDDLSVTLAGFKV